MNPFPVPFPFGHSANGVLGLVNGLWGVLGAVVGGLVAVTGFVAVVAFLILLVRFLVVGTKAAELYLAEHRDEPTGQGPEPAPVPTAGTTPRKRTPKAPPAAGS